jgi:transcriptional regulator with XRE-family HTH domain
MLTQTLTKELSGYQIGEKVHQLRAGRGLTLAELGSHTGMSAAMLSKIERGRLVPTLPTLMRIALVFSVGLEHFFTDTHKRHAFAVVRKKDRIRLPAGDAANAPYLYESLDYEVRDPKLNAWLAHFQAFEGKAPFHDHAGVEFIYVVSGQLELSWGGQSHTLDAGDSVYFDGSVPHSYRRLGKPPCTGVVVTRRD